MIAAPLARGPHDRIVQPAVHIRGLAQPDREGVCSEQRVQIVVGELEAGDHEQPVQGARSLRLGGELIEVGGVIRAVDGARHVFGHRKPGVGGSRRVIRDAENIEPLPFFSTRRF